MARTTSVWVTLSHATMSPYLLGLSWAACPLGNCPAWRPAPRAGAGAGAGAEALPKSDVGTSASGGCGAAPPGQGVDGHRRDQHDRGDDVPGGRAEALESHAVVDGCDHDAAEDGMDGLATPAEQAGPADHGCRNGVEHQRSTVDVRRHRPEA